MPLSRQDQGGLAVDGDHVRLVWAFFFDTQGAFPMSSSLSVDWRAIPIALIQEAHGYAAGD